MRARVTARQPAKIVTVVNEEVVPGELVGVEQEGRDDQGEQRDPEPDESGSPNSGRGEQQHQQQSSTSVDRGTSETGVQNTEGDTSGGETTTGTNVAGTTERQVLMDRLGVDLTHEHLEHEGERAEVLRQTSSHAPDTALSQLLNGQGNERDEEHNEDRHNAAVDPVDYGDQISTVGGQKRIRDGQVRVEATGDGFVLESAKVDQNNHEHLHGKHNEHVVKMEPRVSIVERQEPIQRQLSTEIIVLARQHLLTHTSTDFGCEVQNGAKTQVTTLTTLEVLAMLDTATPENSGHTGVDILVQVQTLLRLGHTTASCHEGSVQEIRVTIVQFTTNLSQSTGE